MPIKNKLSIYLTPTTSFSPSLLFFLYHLTTTYFYNEYCGLSIAIAYCNGPTTPRQHVLHEAYAAAGYVSSSIRPQERV